MDESCFGWTFERIRSSPIFDLESVWSGIETLAELPLWGPSFVLRVAETHGVGFTARCSGNILRSLYTLQLYTVRTI
jgi:hypothetical protein